MSNQKIVRVLRITQEWAKTTLHKSEDFTPVRTSRYVHARNKAFLVVLKQQQLNNEQTSKQTNKTKQNETKRVQNEKEDL